MKNFKFIFITLSLVLFGSSISSCGSNTNEGESTEQLGKEYTSAYVCPMHCKDSGSEEMGTCPVCGMDYVAR
ncbi:MAG: heavy metal-binding domain-containing protein, partial [Bacteroidota bacterium]